jgi:uncharacterized protein GlcG (DUF336 family)
LVVQRGGNIVGAIGAGGGGPDDEKIARAMVKAMGLEIVEDARSKS